MIRAVGSASVALGLVWLMASACDNDGSQDDADHRPDGSAGAGGESDGMTHGDVPTGTEPLSGSRLKQMWWEGGGARRAEGIFDRELGVECRFETMEDESLRCAPLNSEAVVFTDSDCSEALLPNYENECGETSSEFSGVFLSGDDCAPSRYRVFRATEPVETPETIYRLDRGDCVAEDANPDVNYLATERVAPEELVEAEQVVDERTSSLGIGFWSTSDGGYFLSNPINLERGEPCVITTLVEGEGSSAVCLAQAAVSFPGGGYGFSDDACTKAVASLSNACVEPEAIVVRENDSDGCPLERLFEVGAALDNVYQDEAGTCSQVSVEDATLPGNRFEIGGPADDFVELQMEDSPDGDLLTTRHFVFEEEPVQTLPEFWHSRTDEKCAEIPLVNGDRICVPGRHVSLGSSVDSGIFADDECTREVVFGGQLFPCDERGAFTYIVEQSEDICDQTGTIYEAGETFVSDTIYLGGDDFCEPQVNDEESYWVEVGALVDIETDLIRLSRVVDE